MDTVSENFTLQENFFSMLFYTSEEGTRNAIDLFKALSGNNVQAAQKFRVKQDTIDPLISEYFYRFDNRIICFSLQQSISCDLPVRMLTYLCQVYDQLTKNDAMMRYGTKLYKSPTPELYILYIGNSRLNIKELQLSDTFNEQTDSLQLKIKVIDIHINMLIESGLDKCKPLFGYSTFLEKCNALGVEDAISYCIEHDILADFLKKYNADVKKILANFK